MRELEIEFQNILPRALAERGLALHRCNFGSTIGSRVRSRDAEYRVFDSNSKTAWHRNADKVWTANDIYDIDAMSLAVPYCDVVVPDKALSMYQIRLASVSKCTQRSSEILWIFQVSTDGNLNVASQTDGPRFVVKGWKLRSR